MNWFLWTIVFTFYMCSRQCSCSHLVEEDNRSLKHQHPRVRRDINHCAAGINISDSIPEGHPIVTGSKQVERKVDHTITLRCYAYSRTSANVTWVLNNGKTVNYTTLQYTGCKKHCIHTILSRHCYQELQIKEAEVDDSGSYTCVVTNKFGTSKFTTSVKVLQPHQPLSLEEVRLASDNQKAILGGTVKFICTIHSPTTTIGIWRKNKHRVGEHSYNGRLSWDMKALGSKNYEKKVFLSLTNVTAEDEGNWTCVVKGGLPPIITSSTLTLVTVPCPAGHYCPWTENKAYPCPYGTYTNSSSNGTVFSASDCSQCPGIPQGTQPKGKWQPAESLGHCPAATCQEHHYCPNRTSKIRCPQGSYFEWRNATEASDCKKCPVNEAELKNRSQIVKDHCAAPKSPITRNLDGRNDKRLEILLGVFGGITVVVAVVAAIAVYLKRRSHLNSSLYKSSATKSCVAMEKFHKESCQYHQHKNTPSSSTNSSLLAAEEETIPARYDVFITYSSKDGDWVKNLVSMLESRGFNCCIDYRDFLPGNAIVTNIAEAIYQSKRTLAVLSPDFIKSNWCQNELQHALARVRNHKVVPVLYRACVVPLELQDKTYVDWENPDVRPHFWDMLERALKEKPVACSCILETER